MIILLRLIHILAGVFWAGTAIFTAVFLVPSIRALGPAGGPVMQQIAGVRKLPLYFMGAGVLTVLSGLSMYWRASGGFTNAWMHSGSGATFGIGAVFALAAIFDGGVANVFHSLEQAKPVLFWLFLGGFCWVIGDLFQQYAAKYIGISRGIPLSNTNQLWGLAWGALVFGELAHMVDSQSLIVGGSLIMIAGATAISFAEAPADEQRHWRLAMERECARYDLDRERVAAAVMGSDSSRGPHAPRRWWELLIVAAAVSVFVWLGMLAERPGMEFDMSWMLAIAAASLALLIGAVVVLWKRTRFA